MKLYASRDKDSSYVEIWRTQPQRFSNGTFMTGFEQITTMRLENFKLLYNPSVPSGKCIEIDVVVTKTNKDSK